MTRSLRPLALLALALLVPAPPASAQFLDNVQFRWLNHRMAGQLLEFTDNHRGDHRVWSDSLCQPRDLYVYLPPCYDASKQYPVVFYLHGFIQDERSLFLWIAKLDREIQKGCFPPVVVVAPDGSIEGRPSKKNPASFYINSKAGNFEDFLMKDVWDWTHRNFSIRPEREAHALVGVSMGGGAAFDLGIRHRDRVGVLLGIYPPLNVRWLDCHGRYFGNFRPDCWGWRESMTRWHEPVGKFFGGLVRIPLGRMIDPLFDFGPDAIAGMSAHNPLEHLYREDLKDGELQMYVAYAGHDEFNLDAQAESFLYEANRRGIRVDWHEAPWGHHNAATALRLLPDALRWLGPRLEPYAPK